MDSNHCKAAHKLPPDLPATAAAEADHSQSDAEKGLHIFVYRVDDSSLLTPGRSYAICIPSLSVLADGSTKADDHTKPYCFRFSVFTPFLQFPDWPQKNHVTPTETYTDPDLYVWKKVHGTEVVVFGVVDPHLLEHVGGDNFAWKNVRDDSDKRDKGLNTEISISDPVTSLVQAEDYFEKKYKDTNPDQDFHGLRVLLAEMPPEEAKELAEHLPKCLRFDVIITAADDGLATPNQSLTFSPYALPENHAVSCPTNVGASGLSLKGSDFLNGSFATPPTFIAVPPTHEKQPKGGPRLLQARELDVGSDQASVWTYSLRGNPLPIPETEYPQSTEAADPFWLAVCHRLYSDDLDNHCGTPWDHASSDVKQAAIEQLALWTMQQRWHADVALLQERDFYLGGIDEYITDHCRQGETNPPSRGCDPNVLPDLQQLLDRIIWKGDFIRVIPVQGSVLKSILKQSAQFAKAEKTAYLPVSEVGRPPDSPGRRRL